MSFVDRLFSEDGYGYMHGITAGIAASVWLATSTICAPGMHGSGGKQFNQGGWPS